MPPDLDKFLLDRVFQPLVDRLAAVASCFVLARLTLAAAVGLQLVLLGHDLQSVADPIYRAAATGIAALALAGAQQAWAVIGRAEQQSRAGSLNLRRLTLRWQRWGWLGATAYAGATALPAGMAGWALSGLTLAWAATLYLASCTPATPVRRTWRAEVWGWSGA